VTSLHWWRTVFVLIPLIGIYTIVLGTLSVASSLVDNTGRFAHACARAWAWLILATTNVHVAVEHAGRIRTGATYVFVSNHQSIYDIPIIFATLPYQLRIIAKASLGRFPFLGWHLRRTGHLLVDRDRPDHSRILRRWKRLVASGLSLVIFPEGTRSRDGRVGPFKGGSFLLAIDTGIPVVPLSVVGSRHVMLKGRLRTQPGDVRLVIHPPIETVGLSASNARALASRVRDVVRGPVEVDTTGGPS
jgi:1-acyl-sn-glycerol-3-phosphate acyltransferase